MSKYLFKAKFTLIEEGARGYIIEFPEIPELESTQAIYGRELDDAKEHLWLYIAGLIKKDKHIHDVCKDVPIILNKNQFIKEIEVNTDVILEIYDGRPMHQKVFSSITCMSSCEGMCKRVFNDIKKEYEGLPIDVLKEYYRHDKLYGGNDYKYIIELGKLLESLQ